MLSGTTPSIEELVRQREKIRDLQRFESRNAARPQLLSRWDGLVRNINNTIRTMYRRQDATKVGVF